MTDRELMQQALDAMEFIPACGSMIGHVAEMKRVAAVAALRDRLAQTEQEPVAWQGVYDHTDLYYRKPPQADVRPLYTNPPAQPSPVLQQAYSTSAAYTVGFKDGQATQRQPVAWSAQPEVALQYPQDAVEWRKQQQLKAEEHSFKIYKPTSPRHVIPNVRDAELPWVYDQDPSSGNVASMWVTPVKAAPPQRPWVGLTPEERKECIDWATDLDGTEYSKYLAKMIEHKLKEKNK